MEKALINSFRDLIDDNFQSPIDELLVNSCRSKINL